MRIAGVAALLPAAATAAFRPPATPLITTDPYMQTWLMADDVTEATIKHWDGTEKEMFGAVRLNNVTYRMLGRCTEPIPLPSKPGPAETEKDHDVSPGSCDIANYLFSNADTCNERCYAEPTCVAYVMERLTGHCYLKSCKTPVVSVGGKDVSFITGVKPTPAPSVCPEPLQQKSVEVGPTRTTFSFTTPDGTADVELSFLSTLSDTKDYARLSRAVSYVTVAVTAHKEVHDASFYFDMSAQHVVNERAEQVTWQSVDLDFGKGSRIGTTAQKVLGSKGDKTNIDWGYLYVVAPGDAAAARAGGAVEQRKSYFTTGALPAGPDTRKPRNSDDDMPSVAVVQHLGSVPAGQTTSNRVLVGYDDVKSVSYYGEQLPAYWTQHWANITEAMRNASSDAEYDMAMEGEKKLAAQLKTLGDDEYAQVLMLAHRQTLAATKLVWRPLSGGGGVMWNFLKEISTNGDMQTMDVIFPASPMMLYSNPELLKLLLIPVLEFANNATPTPYGSPYSPHQIGTYPIADATTKSQEQMPMENTGNMFLMLNAILMHDSSRDIGWAKKYLPVLTTWAQYLAYAPGSLPYPANQLCTDDFTGRLANNSNLAAKGIVALSSFTRICNELGGSDCDQYEKAAKGYAQTWMSESFESSPKPHYKIAYQVSNSYSIKYNLVWQKLLNMTDGPFPWDEVVNQKEVPYYLSKANKYGTPMDFRHTYVKLDWLSWGGAMAHADDFDAFMHPIWQQANDTKCRVPLTDLFDTITATCAYGKKAFVARPVVGGVFAKAIVPNGWPH